MTRAPEPLSSPGASADDLAARLQAYMRLCAGRRYEAVRVPPFTAYFHPFDAMVYQNYAIPDVELGGDLRDAIEKLRAVARARSRTARFEYINALAPDLEGALLAAGFRREAVARLMVCTKATYVAAPTPEGLELAILSSASPVEEFVVNASTGRRSFSDETPATLEEAEKTRADLMNGRAFLGRFGGSPASVALVAPPEDGISELAGVGTVPEFRGRGFGAAIVSRAAAAAFELGVEILFLSTITEEAGRLYERVGFRYLTSMLFCVDGGGEAHAP